MAQAEARVTRTSGGSEADPYMQRVSTGLQRSANAEYGYSVPQGVVPEWPVQYHVYIFNIAEREFEIQKPPMFPRVKFRACPRGEKYVMVAKIPNVVMERPISAETGQFMHQPYQGERVAMDIINPQNASLDQDAPIPENVSWMDLGGSNDLGRRGLFWSVNEVPTDEELAKARARLDRFYRQKVQEGSAIAADPKRAGDIAPEHHLAAEYLSRTGMKFSWHNFGEMPEVCPNCGEDIKKGAAFHTNSAGVICVLDWNRAIRAGVKTPEDYKKAQAATKAMEEAGA